MQSLFPLDVLDEILDLIDSVSGGFPTYSNPETRLWENFCTIYLEARRTFSVIPFCFTCNYNKRAMMALGRSPEYH